MRALPWPGSSCSMRGARLWWHWPADRRALPFARGFRLEIARNTHFTRATVIDHIKFEYTGGGGKIGDMLHITFSTLAHGGILPKDQRAHTQLAGESAKEENV